MVNFCDEALTLQVNVKRKKLNNILKNMNTGEISKPISYPSGYLLLKMNDKKELNLLHAYHLA